MINFEDIIDFLAIKGVKSLHIEMQEQQLTDEERARLTYRLPRNEVEQRRGEQLVLIDGKVVTGRLLTDEEVTVLKNTKSVFIPSVCARAAKHDQVVHQGEPGAGESVVVVVPTPKKAVAVPPVETKPVETKSTPVPEPTKPAEPVVEKKAAPEPAKKAVAETVAKSPDKKLYDSFCDMISSDDGKVTAEERVTLINLMGLDDLLRVNNDFQLGLDTDKPVDDVRSDVIECFK